jgi:hypothetical protein
VNLEFLDRDRLEDSLCLELTDVLLPLFRSSQRTQVRKEQLNLNVKGCVQILWFDIYFSSEQAYVIDFYFLLTVADEK